jgi:hypothetical protein
MTRKFFTVLLLGIALLLSCETEQVIVERIRHDTVWVEKPPIQIIETKTDTVWQTKTVHDTVIVSQQVVTTDTIFIEKVIELIDTVYKDVIKTVTVIEVDTVLVDRVEIVENRLTIAHPGLDNHESVYGFDEAITEWLTRVKEAGLQPKWEAILFTPVRWGPIPIGISIFQENGIYYGYTDLNVDPAVVWRVLSNILLDIPLIEVGSDIEYYDDWWEGEVIGVKMKPQYDHMMFVFFPYSYYEQSTPERQAWYWEDMLNSHP